MSTWAEVVTYIKTQLRPGVLGNTNVQKILNAVLAVIQQINAGDFTPSLDAIWKADVNYASDIQPVLWQDQWLVSNIEDNLGNVPISISGVIHPTWRVIGSSPGSGIRMWQAIVYPNTLEIVFNEGQLYFLNRAVVGADPFVSVDFESELGEEIWVALLEIPDHNYLEGIQGGTWHLTEEEHSTLTEITREVDEDGNTTQHVFPVQVKGQPAVNDDEFVTKAQLESSTGGVGGSGISWFEIDADIIASLNSGYIAVNDVSKVNVTLPDTTDKKSVRVSGRGLAGWRVSIPVGKSLKVIDVELSGWIESTLPSDGIELVSNSDGNYIALSIIGNLNYNA